ncbi:MAG: hypothetical protein LBH11_02110 [Propionibacteriaceae bacterium]|jgi:hypothetical protein|nr:hypothetical protein [Propionibacteriaceae bacterium]
MSESQQEQLIFVGEHVQIGGGFMGIKPLAQNGAVTVSQSGQVVLYGTKGQVIDSGPAATAIAKKMFGAGTSVRLTLGENSYTISTNSSLGRVMSGDIGGIFGGSLANRIASVQGNVGLIEAIGMFQQAARQA